MLLSVGWGGAGNGYDKGKQVLICVCILQEVRWVCIIWYLLITMWLSANKCMCMFVYMCMRLVGSFFVFPGTTLSMH